MVTDSVLIGNNIYIRQIKLEDCTDEYVKWLNDPQVNQYLETRWTIQDIDSIKSFVKYQRENEHSYLFAIICKNDDRHIGNIKLGPIEVHHKHADISYFIGDKESWGKGFATEAISLICEFGFSELNLHRIEAGSYRGAVGSWKALERNGFKREAVFREQALSGEKYTDVYRYGLILSEWVYR